MSVFQLALIKIGALFSFCGGPLVLSDMLKPRLGTFVALAVTFVPIVLMIFGTESLFDPSPRRRGLARNPLSREEPDPDDGAEWGILFVRLGLVGALLTLLMHGYGAWVLATTPPRPDHGLYVFGIVVGIPLAGWYAYAARGWLNRVDAPRDPFAPIEPR